MTQVYIPEIGTRIVLEEDWCFKLRPEHRNDALYNGYTDKLPSELHWKESQKALLDEDSWLIRTLPKKTELVIDNIYVRKNGLGWSTIGMYVTKTTDEKLLQNKQRTIPFVTFPIKHYGRFVVKLEYFNKATAYVKDNVYNLSPEKGRIITFAEFKNRNGHYWVDFEHSCDKSLSFSAEINPTKLYKTRLNQPAHNKNTFILSSIGITTLLQAASLTATSALDAYQKHLKTLEEAGLYCVGDTKECTYTKQKYNEITPKFYFDNLTPYKLEKNKNKKQLELAKKIHIPRSKKDRVPMGIKTDKSLMENIKVFGGKLTVHELGIMAD